MIIIIITTYIFERVRGYFGNYLLGGFVFGRGEPRERVHEPAAAGRRQWWLRGGGMFCRPAGWVLVGGHLAELGVGELPVTLIGIGVRFCFEIRVKLVVLH